MKKIIAIDGPAASGKGTLSRALAAKLSFAHMDTGALYRAVGVNVLSANGDPDNLKDALAGCGALKQQLKLGNDVLGKPELRTDEAGNAASKVSVHQTVRDALVDIQRDFAHSPPAGFDGSILDGRDIGTVICPEAPIKFFVTAKTEIRAARRQKELQSKGLDVTYEAVLEDMRARDTRDSGRKAAPLKPAEDAIMLDSSDMSPQELLEIALDYAKKAFG
ncbi:MAG: (d)CMP kinase [Alphaproteobacteria bacterium]|nr:(d)CMP kinase [Alphaproteobacteria bacterium]